MPAPVNRISSTPLSDHGKAVRILAVGTKAEGDRFVVVTKLNEALELNRHIESFGYFIEACEEASSITSIFKLTFASGIGIMNCGTQDAEVPTTNIYDKQIRIGELFTVDLNYPDVEFQITFAVRSISDF